MKRGDLVKMKPPAPAAWVASAGSAAQAAHAVRRQRAAVAFWAMRIGVIIEVIEDTEPAGDQCIVYWSDNIKSSHWETDLEVK